MKSIKENFWWNESNKVLREESMEKPQCDQVSLRNQYSICLYN